MAIADELLPVQKSASAALGLPVQKSASAALGLTSDPLGLSLPNGQGVDDSIPLSQLVARRHRPEPLTLEEMGSAAGHGLVDNVGPTIGSTVGGTVGSPFGPAGTIAGIVAGGRLGQGIQDFLTPNSWKNDSVYAREHNPASYEVGSLASMLLTGRPTGRALSNPGLAERALGAAKVGAGVSATNQVIDGIMSDNPDTQLNLSNAPGMLGTVLKDAAFNGVLGSSVENYKPVEHALSKVSRNTSALRDQAQSEVDRFFTTPESKQRALDQLDKPNTLETGGVKLPLGVLADAGGASPESTQLFKATALNDPTNTLGALEQENHRKISEGIASQLAPQLSPAAASPEELQTRLAAQHEQAQATAKAAVQAEIDKGRAEAQRIHDEKQKFIDAHPDVAAAHAEVAAAQRERDAAEALHAESRGKLEKAQEGTPVADASERLVAELERNKEEARTQWKEQFPLQGDIPANRLEQIVRKATSNKIAGLPSSVDPVLSEQVGGLVDFYKSKAKAAAAKAKAAGVKWDGKIDIPAEAIDELVIRAAAAKRDLMANPTADSTPRIQQLDAFARAARDLVRGPGAADAYKTTVSDTFSRKGMNDILAAGKKGDAYKVDPSQAGERVTGPGTSRETGERLMKGTKGNESNTIPLVENALAAAPHNSAELKKWQRLNQPWLEAMPGAQRVVNEHIARMEAAESGVSAGKQKLADAETTYSDKSSKVKADQERLAGQVTTDAATAARDLKTKTSKELTESPVGKLASVDPQGLKSKLQGILDQGGDPIGDMKRLIAATSKDPRALAALKNAHLEYLHEKAKNSLVDRVETDNTTQDVTTAQKRTSEAKLSDIVTKNSDGMKIAELLHGKDSPEMGVLRQAANQLEAMRRPKAAGPVGGSNTREKATIAEGAGTGSTLQAIGDLVSTRVGSERTNGILKKLWRGDVSKDKVNAILVHAQFDAPLMREMLRPVGKANLDKIHDLLVPYITQERRKEYVPE